MHDSADRSGAGSGSRAPMEAVHRWRAAADARPRIALAVKSAVAASIAWLCVQPLGGVAADYPYYAPFGAVVAVTSTFASSMRSSTQAVAAIVAGAAVATAARLLPLPEFVALAAVVAVGTGIAGWRKLGEMGSWVPVSGVFVLIVGAGDPAPYVAAYLGLTTLGALVGIVINGLFPPLPLTATSLALRRLRAALADQLVDVADGLTQEELPSAPDWQRRQRHLQPHVEDVRGMVQQTTEARRANWRARHWRETASRQYRHARTLEGLAGLVEQVVALVIERECAEAREVALGPGLRPVTARSLEAVSRVLRADPFEPEWHRAYAELLDSLEELRDATRTAWRDEYEDRFTAAAIIVALERAAHSLHDTAESKAEGTPTNRLARGDT